MNIEFKSHNNSQRVYWEKNKSINQVNFKQNEDRNAEQERLKQEDLARQQAEQERLKQEELARQQAEQERLKQEDLARQQAEQERLKQEDLTRQQAEQERLTKNTINEQKLTVQFFASSSQDKKFDNISDLGVIIIEKVPGRNLYRYKLGYFKDISDANDVISKLRGRGYGNAFIN